MDGDMAVASWTDSALFNSFDDTNLETDEELKVVEKHLVRSQHGSLTCVVDGQQVKALGPVRVSPPGLDLAREQARGGVDLRGRDKCSNGSSGPCSLSTSSSG